MSERSHVDIDKLERVPEGKLFTYRDVVEDDFPEDQHTEDGKRFKAEVKSGEFDLEIVKSTDSHLIYKKL